MSGLVPWQGKFNDPNIKKVNFLQGNQNVIDGRDYLGELEQEIEEKKRFSEVALLPDVAPPKLSLKVLAARDLLSTNSNGASDPCATICLHDVKVKTAVHKKTLDPVWDFEHEFEIDPTIFNEIEISVWDYSNNQENFLGVVYLDLGKLESQRGVENRETDDQWMDTQPRWLELLPRKWNEHVGGEILVQAIRTGKRINRVAPRRPRKQDIFDLELSRSEAELLLDPVEYCKYSKITAMHKTGALLFNEVKLQTADLDSGSIRPRKKRVRWGTPTKSRTIRKSEFSRRNFLPSTISLTQLPEEVLFRIFLFLNVVERAYVARVCWDWNRILQDPGLRSPLLEILEIIEKEKRETDTTLKRAHGLHACEKLKPVVLSLTQLCEWQKETAIILTPFPIENKDSVAVLETLATIRALTQITQLAWSIDKWKHTLHRACRAFKDAFRFFEVYYHLLSGSSQMEIISAHFVNDCISFLDSQTLRGIFSYLGGPVPNAGITQILTITKIVLAQIQKQRYITISEFSVLLEFLGVSLLWLMMSGHTDVVKIHKLQPRKIIKLLKDNEELVPVWVLESLASTSYVKTNRKIYPLVKDYSL